MLQRCFEDDDVFAHILSNLAMRDMVYAAQVDSRWRMLCLGTPALWWDAELDTGTRSSRERFLTVLARSKAANIHITAYLDVGTYALLCTELAANLPRVVSFSLSVTQSVFSPTLPNGWPRLLDVLASSDRVRIRHVGLNLSDCSNHGVISLELPRMLAESTMPRLTSLSLRSTKLPGALILSTLHDLEAPLLSFTEATLESFATRFPRLRILTVAVGPIDIPPAANLSASSRSWIQSLERLTVRRHVEFSQRSYVRKGVGALVSMPRLAVYDLDAKKNARFIQGLFSNLPGPWHVSFSSGVIAGRLSVSVTSQARVIVIDVQDHVEQRDSWMSPVALGRRRHGYPKNVIMCLRFQKPLLVPLLNDPRCEELSIEGGDSWDMLTLNSSFSTLRYVDTLNVKLTSLPLRHSERKMTWPRLRTITLIAPPFPELRADLEHVQDIRRRFAADSTPGPDIELYGIRCDAPSTASEPDDALPVNPSA